MANQIILKKSSVAAKAPVAADLEYGELALNYSDGKLYYKKADNSIDAFTAGTGGGSVTQVYPTNSGIVRYSSTTGTWELSLDQPSGNLVGTTESQILSNKTIAYGANTLTGVQPTLVSGTNIKTINGSSILGSGDLTISGGGSSSYTINNKIAAYTVVASDLGSIINCTSGSFTISLTSASTLGAGFNCWIWNTSTNNNSITIDPDGSDTIEGKSTHILWPGEGVEVVCTGISWIFGGKRAMRGYAESMPTTSPVPVASGTHSVSLGSSNTASASYAAALGGQSNTASGIGSITLGGQTNAASGDYSTAGGKDAVSAQYGKWAYASGRVSAGVGVGSAQTGIVVLKAQSSGSTPIRLRSSSSEDNIVASNQITLSNNSTFAFSAIVVAKAYSNNSSAAWKIEGMITRGSTAASITLVASNITTISNAPGWSIAVSADTTNGCLAITGTGVGTTDLAWVATVYTSEVIAY